MSALKNGALYIRVSTADQTELSPDAQQRLLLDYAKKNGIVIAKKFIFEESVSGRHADRRPKFQEMIALAKQESHPIDVILVWKYSRFARNQEESIVYKSLLKKSNVDVISISEPLIDGPFGTLIERIIEWMDEYYSIRLSGEVLRGMKEKALQHGYQTTPCLGYQAAGGGKPFVIDEAEYQIVKYIMDQYDLEHLDPTAIARKCNDLGYRTRRGNRMERRSIERVLRNPFYAGADFSFTVRDRKQEQEDDETIQRLQHALDHLAVREARVKMAYENGIDTLEEYGANKKRLAEERQSLQEELNRVLTPAAPPETISKEDFRKEIKNINDILKNPEEPTEKKGLLLRSIVDRIVYEKSSGTMYFDFLFLDFPSRKARKPA